QRDLHPFPTRRSSDLSAGHQLVAALRLEAGIDALYDWQGGLVWMQMEADPEADLLRRYIRALGGGHATLVRAPEQARAALPAFEDRKSTRLNSSHVKI